MRIGWLAIKFDWSASLYLLEPPIFPIVPAAEELYRQWIATASVSTASELAVAAFALENLMHKACHLAAQIHILRRTKPNSPEIRKKIISTVALLEAESLAWINRPAIQAAANEEQTAQQTLPSFDHKIETFLNYPPLRILNPFYAHLLNSWRAIQIYVSLFHDPFIGPESCPQRFSNAVDICRTWAALTDDTTMSDAGKMWICFLAGAAFGGVTRSPKEALWIKKMVDDFAVKLPFLRKGIVAYELLWDTVGDFWIELERARPKIKN